MIMISFQHEVLPIMISACAYSGCHDVISAEEDIILDSYEQVVRIVVPGKPDNSELYEYIVTPDGDDIMPPPPANPLTRKQIDVIREWILQGAENTTCGTSCDSNQTSFSYQCLSTVTRLLHWLSPCGSCRWECSSR